MPFFLFQFLIKRPYFRTLLLTRLRSRYPNQTVENISKDYVLKLLDFVDVTEITTTYKPLVHGNIKLRTHCKNADEFLERCTTIADAIDKDGSITPIKRMPKITSIDDWLTDDEDVPMRMDYVVTAILPEIKRLCRALIKQQRHESIGYFQRQSSKVLHDAKCLIEALLDITN